VARPERLGQRIDADPAVHTSPCRSGRVFASCSRAPAQLARAGLALGFAVHATAHGV
jgi:hypothetical protein